MMKNILTLIGAATLVAACSNGTSDDLRGGNPAPGNPNATAGGDDTTFDHNNDPAGAVDNTTPATITVVGSPEVAARLHACGKMTNSSVAALLTSRGLTGAGAGRPAGSLSGQAIFNAGLGALGASNYAGRVPEAPFASTASMSKLYDVFAMASYDAADPAWNAPACPGTKLIDGGKFTQAGITCLIGKPATQVHVDIANDALVKGGADGAKIAITALLSAAETCQ